MTGRSRQIFATRVSGPPGLAEKVLDVVGTIPEPRQPKSDTPERRARELTRRASIKAAATAGTLALPVGPLGWLTIAPELYAVWRIQAQLVADIAGAHGKAELLSREQMLYCLFGHTAAGAFRDLVIRVGERYVVRRAPLSALYAIANKIGIRIAQRSAGRVVTRWVPALGALGVAGYVYADTGHVADTSIELFSADIRIEGELEVEGAAVAAELANQTAVAARSDRADTSGRAGSSRTRARSPRKHAAKATASKKAAAKPRSTAKKPRATRAKKPGPPTGEQG